ncbi:MAG: 6-phosphogluconolactonase [Calditrichia bacterium]
MIKVFPNLEELSKAAAQMFTDLSVKAAKETGILSVALSGGHTPTETYKLLSQKPYQKTGFRFDIFGPGKRRPHCFSLSQ